MRHMSLNNPSGFPQKIKAHILSLIRSMPDSLYLIKTAVKSAYKQILFCLQALFFYFSFTFLSL